MYRNLALINGTILAIMIFFNGMLSNILGPYLSTLVFHILGFILVAIIAILASAFIDYIYLDIFSKGKVLGALLFLIALTINAKIDDVYQLKKV